MSDITPSEIAYAPQTRTSAASVTPGQINAKIPNKTAKSPRSEIQCQARAKFSSMDEIAIFTSLAANAHPHRVRRCSVQEGRISALLRATNFFILLAHGRGPLHGSLLTLGCFCSTATRQREQ